MSVTPKLLLAATRKVLALHNNEVDPDSRDDLVNQTLHSADDYFAERIENDAGGLGRNILWKSTFKGKLAAVPHGALTPQLQAVFTTSGLAMPVEEINPLELYDQNQRVLRVGEGGIGSTQAIPEEAKNVQPSYLGFIDPFRGPESEKLGVDNRFTLTTYKGSDNRLYTDMVDIRTGKVVRVDPGTVHKAVVAFPGELEKGKRIVRAMVNGQMRYVDRSKVQYTLPNPNEMFNLTVNMVPFMSATQGNRLLMAGKMALQALPLAKGEAPLVQAATPDGKSSFDELAGKYMGAIRADKPGVVISTRGGKIKVSNHDGTTSEYELYENFPLNRKTALHNEPLVRTGDVVKAGHVLARSNFTDDTGTNAAGVNLRVAFMGWKGLPFEDAYVISESAAKKLTSEHLYQHAVEREGGIEHSKSKYISLFPGKYDRKQIQHFTDNGVIKPGVVVRKGDPLILAVAPAKSKGEGQWTHALKHGKAPWLDKSVTWDHDAPGVVTDVVETKGGVQVTVKSTMPMQEGDKLCYDTETEILTADGWKRYYDLTLADRFASLTPAGKLEYVPADSINAYWHVGDMYRLETQSLSFCVTMDHKQYVKRRYGKGYEFIKAKELIGKRVRYKKDAKWVGSSAVTYRLAPMVCRAGQAGNGTRELPARDIPLETYMMLLGMYLSEGSTIWHEDNGTYALVIHQVVYWDEMIKGLDAAGITYADRGDRVIIYDKQLVNEFRGYGSRAHNKFIPSHVYRYNVKYLKILLRWLMWGDGNRKNGEYIAYGTTSRRLAGDIQRLCLHIGYAANISVSHCAETHNICGRTHDVRTYYRVGIIKKKLAPTVNHSHVREQHTQHEYIMPYCGTVWCVTLPRNHTLYVRRNGKAAWSGNSARYGDKGVVAKIVPDEQMPRDEQGRPFDIIQNPLTLPTRLNPAQLYEMQLAKVARKLGRPVRVPAFLDKPMVDWVQEQLKKHGLKDTEHVFDPSINRKVKDVMTGEKFFMKLHHTAEAKGGERSMGAYTSEELPAKGGKGGAKTLANSAMNALIAHNAEKVMQDAKLYRGQRNEDFWRLFRQGFTPSSPNVPLVYKKMLASLAAAGINIKKTGNTMHLMALTDKDIDRLSRGKIATPSTVTAKDLQPIPGGLFDRGITGGIGGKNYSHIELTEPLPNPVMEDPIKKVLGLTGRQFEDILAGKVQYDGKTGGQAIKDALARVDIDKQIAADREALKSASPTRRDQLIKRLRYLTTAKEQGIHPKEWVLSKALVLPPVFRPISNIKDKVQVVADANYLYQDLLNNNEAWAGATEQFGDAGEERLATYKAFKAVTGLGDPVHPKLVSKGVSGLLKHVFGKNSPKYGMLQRRVLGAATDFAARGTITPNPSLDIDQVGLPEDQAWELYKPFVIRRLVRKGMNATDAAKLVENKDKRARVELQTEMEHRPVLITRAPVLHKYGVMAAMPVLTKGRTLQVPPATISSFAGDFDGDTMSYHVPVSDDAVREAKQRMLPSANLLSASTLKVHYTPSQEYLLGLYQASTKRSHKAPVYYKSKEDVIKAYRRGEIGLGDHVVILENK